MDSDNQTPRATSSGPARRLVRWGLRALTVLVAIVVLVLASLLVALQFPAGRQLALRIVSLSMERTVGVRVEADALRLGLLGGWWEADGMRLAAAFPDSPPFLEISHVHADIEWLSALEPRMHIREVIVRGARLDLAPPMIAPTADYPSWYETDLGMPVDVPRFEITDFEVVGPTPGDGETWLEDWLLAGGRLTGTVRDGGLVAEIEAPLLVRALLPGEQQVSRWEGTLRAATEVGRDGAMSVPALEVSGPGVDLAARGSAHMGAFPDFEAEGSARINPADRWAAGNVVEGLDARGNVSLHDGALTVALVATADALPGETLDPLLAELGLADLVTRGRTLELDADVDIALNVDEKSDREERLSGTAEATWRHADEVLARAKLEADEPSPLDLEASRRATFEARIGHGAANTVELEGAAALPSWKGPDRATIERSQAKISLANVHEFMDGLWELPADTRALLPQGSLTGDVIVAGPLMSPTIDAELTWTTGSVEVAATTLNWPARRGRPGIEIAARLLPASPGHREVRGTVQPMQTAMPVDLLVDLQVPDLSGAGGEIEALWPQLFPADQASVDKLQRLGASGLLRGHLDLELAARGPSERPHFEIKSRWLPGGEQRLDLAAVGEASWEAPHVAPGSVVEIALARFELADWIVGDGPTASPETAGLLDGTMTVGLDEEGHLRGDIGVELEGLVLGGKPWLEGARLGGRLERDELTVARLSGRLSCTAASCVEASFAGDGRFTIAPDLDGRMKLHLDTPRAAVSGLNSELLVTDGVATLRVWTDDPVGEASIAVPLGTIAAMLPEALPAEYTETWPSGPAAASAEMPALGPWVALLMPPDETAAISGSFAAKAHIDPARPLAATGEATLENLRFDSRDGKAVEAEAPLGVIFANGRIGFPAFTLTEPETDSRLAASAWLKIRQEWTPDNPIEMLVTDLGIDASGSLDADLLNPYLQGAVATGTLSFDLEGRWIDGILQADLDLTSPDGTVLAPAKYLTRVEKPRIHVEVRGREITVEDSEFVLNRGLVKLSGRAVPGEEATLTAAFDGVRYRVDFGMHLLTGGELTVSRRGDGVPAVSGHVVVDRGLLRRDIYLDLGLLRSFSLGDAAATEASPVDPVELDILVYTNDGVKIDNNVAELALSWPVVRVGGTIGQPVIAGRVDAVAGGWLEAMGVLLRVDELSVEVFEDPSIEPEIRIATTSILDDPTLYEQRREGLWYNAINADAPQNDLFFGETSYGSEVAMTQFSASLASYFGDTLARFLGTEGSLSFSVQPLPLYGNTSSDARFTLSQQLGRYAKLIASSDARQTESQTYILEFGDLVPRTIFQLFSNDIDNSGSTLQIVKPLGWRSGKHPRLAGIDWRLPETIRERRLTRSISLRRGDPVPPGAEFAVEIDVVEALHALGYPGSAVTVTRRPVGDDRVRLEIEVAAGPRVQEEFNGITIPLGYRRLIFASYLPSELDLGASMEEVRAEAERSLRRLGHFRPRVTVREVEVAGVPFDEARVVEVVSAAEARVQIQSVRFPGLPADDQARLARNVESSLARLELAEGLPGADQRLRRLARALGYPDLQILDRRIDPERQELVVEVEAGTRMIVASVEVTGLPADHADIEDRISLVPGSPARRSDLATQGRSLVQALRDYGYPHAELDLEIAPRTDSPEQVDVIYKLTPGPPFVVADVSFEGQRHTDGDLLDELVTLEPGAPFRNEDLAESKRNLFRTTLFESIDTSFEPIGGSGDEIREKGGKVRGVFELEEGPRYLMSYGGRWETTRGASVIVDLIDRNAFGRGQTFGTRLVLGESVDAFRAYYGLPRVPTADSSLEFFAEWIDQDSRFSCRAIEDAGFYLPNCDLSLLPPDLQDLVDDVRLRTEELTLRGQMTLPLNRSTQIRPFVAVTKRNGSVVAERQIPDTQEQTAPGLNPDDTVSPQIGLQIAHDTRTRGLGGIASSGLFVGFELSGSHRNWGGDVTVLEAVVEAKHFREFGNLRGQRLLWAQRARAGAQLTRHGTRVPVPDQFTAGGEFSLRGYPTESFGPGQVQLILNEELHVPLWSQLKGVAFLDAGNIWADWDGVFEERTSCSNDCPPSIFSSVGVGLRFSAFRLDYAVPLDRRPGDPDYQIFFGFGNAF